METYSGSVTEPWFRIAIEEQVVLPQLFCERFICMLLHSKTNMPFWLSSGYFGRWCKLTHGGKKLCSSQNKVISIGHIFCELFVFWSRYLPGWAHPKPCGWPWNFCNSFYGDRESLGDQLFSIKSWLMLILTEGSGCLSSVPWLDTSSFCMSRLGEWRGILAPGCIGGWHKWIGWSSWCSTCHTDAI